MALPRSTLLTLCVLVTTMPLQAIAQSSVAATSGSVDHGEQEGGRLSMQLNLLLDGNSGLQKLAPELFLGGEFKVGGMWHVRAGPTVSTTQFSVDERERLRGLMLPGNLNLDAMLYNHTQGDEWAFNARVGAGLKSMSFDGPADEDPISLLQEYFTVGASISHMTGFQFGAQYTWGYHDLTNEAEDRFRSLFPTRSGTTHIQYLSVSLTTQVVSGGFLTAAWRWTKDSGRFGFPSFSRVLSLGIRADTRFDFPFSEDPAPQDSEPPQGPNGGNDPRGDTDLSGPTGSGSVTGDQRTITFVAEGLSGDNRLTLDQQQCVVIVATVPGDNSGSIDWTSSDTARVAVTPLPDNEARILSKGLGETAVTVSARMGSASGTIEVNTAPWRARTPCQQ